MLSQWTETNYQRRCWHFKQVIVRCHDVCNDDVCKLWEVVEVQFTLQSIHRAPRPHSKLSPIHHTQGKLCTHCFLVPFPWHFPLQPCEQRMQRSRQWGKHWRHNS